MTTLAGCTIGFRQGGIHPLISLFAAPTRLATGVTDG